ncbi:Hypothetical protein A7982_06814 [Minicystis rosea]|nr:Hypothetical protein A7982_06814 [Minicystis rosea]
MCRGDHLSRLLAISSRRGTAPAHGDIDCIDAALRLTVVTQ